MKSIDQCTVGIVGLGLMGGAFAMAIRNRCGVAQGNLYACDIDGNALALAEKAGLIAKGFSGSGAGEMLAKCDLVFLCLSPAALLDFIAAWERAFKPGALVTDIAGVKECIAAAAEKFRPDADFIPGHPMAGTHQAGGEKCGFADAALCDFTGKNYILTPLERNKPENLQFLKSLIRTIGLDRIAETSPAGHDRNIAFTRQLCHVLAAALIGCEADASIFRFGGGSLEDFTRIAMLNVPMWTELFITNKKALIERIDQFEGSLQTLKSLICRENKTELEQLLAEVRRRRMENNKNDA
jgi:prephenate dehydrogenase